MKEFILVMKALSDPNRTKIIKMLERKKFMCVCEIHGALNLAQPTISKHLRQLEDAGLIESFKDKQWVNYRLVSKTENPYVRTLLKNLRGWLNDTQDITALDKMLPSLDRRQLCKK